MTLTKETILQELSRVQMPKSGATGGKSTAGKSIVDLDMVRAIVIEDGAEGNHVRFVLEAAPDDAPRMEPVRAAAQQVVADIAGVGSVQVVLTAHAPPKPPPSLKIGGHPKPSADRQKIDGVKQIIAVGSGKGGVGKSTLSCNLAIALAQTGLRIGLLDADIHGPSQPHMMGVSARPQSPDGKRIIPLIAHGVTMMSLGLMVAADQAVIWRGPMLMGALQQMLLQVEWGELDILLVDLPPGTGDVQLTLSQKIALDGAVIVSTPQDIALLDARKALDMFVRLNIPIYGLVENMAHYICPKCGDTAHIFGTGGAKTEATKQNIAFLGEIPLDLSIRQSGDDGVPIVVVDKVMAKSYQTIAKNLLHNI